MKCHGLRLTEISLNDLGVKNINKALTIASFKIGILNLNFKTWINVAFTPCLNTENISWPILYMDIIWEHGFNHILNSFTKLATEYFNCGESVFP